MPDEKQPDLTLRVTGDRLALAVSCDLSGEQDILLLVRRIQRELVSQRIPCDLSEDRLAAWLREAAGEGTRIKDAELLRGQAAKPPLDGRIEWGGDFFAAGFVVDPETGAIDYRQHSAQRTVEEGQLLARMFPPQEGKDGRDVFGKRIRVRRPRTVRIRAGDNVRLDESEMTLYATACGRIRWASESLSVDTVYVIDGCVDLKSGNVHHRGAVKIAKDVREGAKVTATGDIEVSRVVEAADIETGGDLTVRGGIMGGRGRRIRVDGGIQAKFILDADIEAEGDIVVEREIVHTRLKTRGAVVMPKGRLIGGETLALGGITLGQAGSSAAVPTVVIVGEDYREKEKLAGKEQEIVQVEQTLARLEGVLKPMARQGAKLSHQQRELVAQLLSQADELKTTIEGLRDQAEEIKEDSRQKGNFGIEIREKIYPEVILCIGDERLRVDRELDGPARALLVDGRVSLQAVAK